MNFLAENKKGFTLIEILVASAIFVTATVMVTDIFVRVNNVQRKTQGIQTTATDARFSFEVMAREARVSEIDYLYYGGTVNLDGETELALITASQDTIRFGLQSGAACPTGTTSCLAICITNTCAAGDWESITPQGINISNLIFYIYPDVSPFIVSGLGYDNNSQPRVTIVMTTTNITNDEVERASFTIQTTVSTRIYKR